jgi:hypothetical protein
MIANQISRTAMLEDHQAAQMLMVLWRIERLQLNWTQLVTQRRELGKFVNVTIPALEGHGTERLRMRLWHDDYQRGLQKLPKAARAAWLGYVEAKTTPPCFGIR